MIRPRRRRLRQAGLILTTAAMMNLIIPPVARAGPSGGGGDKDIRVDRVVRGEARLDRDGVRTNIHVSNNAVIDYRRFNIPRGQEVRFIQPGSDSRVLNRVLSSDPSRIDGTLRGNGTVYLVNPSGLIFGPTSVIDVGRFYAAAGQLGDADFLAGVDRFTDLRGTVRQQGVLAAADGVALLGRRVINSGQITTQRGTVVLASGDRVYLAEQGSKVMVRVDNLDADTGKGAGRNADVTDATGVLNHASGSVDGDEVVFAAGDVYGLAIHNAGKATATDRVALTGHGRVTNDGQLTAAGGRVTMLGEQIGHLGGTIDVSGQQGGSVLLGGDFQGKGDVRNASITFVDRDATILADALSGDAGRVIVWSDDTTRFLGVIRARSEASGGFAEVSGKRYLDYRGFADLRSFDGLSTGALLLDPHNLTIRTAGPDAGVTGASPFSTTADNAILTVASIQAALALADVLIQTSAGGTQQGDITIQNAITHPGGVRTLTIDAHRHINLNADIDLATNAATGLLSLRAGVGGTGNIIDGGGTLRLGGGSLQLRAVSGIGTATDRIETTGLANFAATTASGGIFVNNSSAGLVTVASVNGTNGFTATSSGILSLQTAGSLAVTAPVSSSNNVILRATGGALTGTSSITAASTTLVAANGISNGSGGNLDLTTGILDATNTATGDIRILEANALSIYRLDQQGPGAINVATTAGAIDITTTQSGVSSAGVAGGTGNVSITAGGAGSDLSVNAPITLTAGGDLSLTAANRVTFSAAGDIATTGGAVGVTATAADIAMNSGTTVTSGAGAITLTAGTGIGLGALTTTNATNAAVTLTAGTAGAGAITDIGAATEVTATSGRLVVTATSGIGSGNAIETTVASIDAQNGTNNLAITESNNIDVQRLTNTGSGTINLITSANVINILAGGSGVNATSGDITLSARDGMTIDQNITTTGGSITINADSNNTAPGNLNIADGVTITTGGGGGSITARAFDITFGATTLLDAGAGDIALMPSLLTRTIGIGDGAVGQFHIDTTEMTQRLATTGTLTIGHANGTGAVNFPALDLSAQNFSLHVQGGTTTLNSGGTITMATGRNLSLTSNGAVGITLADDLAAPNGTVTLTANRLDLQAGGSVTANAVTLRNTTTNTAINIGSTTDAAASTLEISNAEMGRITTTGGALTLGSTTAGAITITDDVTAAVTPTLHLIGASTVSQTPGSAITATNLAISGGVSVTLTDAGNDVDTLAMSLTGSGNVTYTDADSFTVGTVNGLTSIALGNSGTSTLTATTGAITMAAATTGTGGSLVLLADDLDLQTTINAAAGHVTLAPVTPGTSIQIGTVGDATAATLELSDPELDLITTTTTGTLRIGSAVADDITFTAALTNSTAANIRFITADSITQNAGATITAANVAFVADSATLGLTNNLSGLAAAISGAGNAFTFTDSDALAIRPIDGISGVSTNGGAIALSSGAGTTVNLTNSAGSTITSGGADITLLADRMSLVAGSVIDAGAGRVTIRTPTAGRQIRLEDTDATTRLALSSVELNTITAGALTIGATDAGSIRIEADTTLTSVDTLQLHTNSTLQDFGRLTVTNLAIRAAGAVTLDHASGHSVENLAAVVTTAGAAFTFANDDDLTITTVDGVGGITTNAGTITLQTLAVNSTFTNAAAIASGAAGIVLDVNRVDLQPGSSITATGGTTVTLRNYNAATAFNLGSATDLAGNTIELSAAEINTISAANLVLGRSTAGAIAITSAIAPANGTTLSLVSGSTISQLAGATITETNLMLQAGGDVTLTAANDVDTLAATLSAGDLAFTDADEFTVNTVNSVIGVTTVAGDIALTATTGRITTSQALASGGGDVTLTADQMAINAAGTINAGAGDVSLRPSTPGTAIDLGSAVDTTPGTLELSDTELDRVTAASVTIGNAAAGPITLSTAISPANTTTLHLASGGDITQGAGDTLTVANATLTSAGQVTLTQANDVNTLAADLSSGAGSLQFTDNDDLTVAAGGITTAGGGVTLITANTGLLTNLGAIATNDGDVTLTADRMALAAGTIDSGVGRTTLRSAVAGRAIDLGSATDAAAALELSDVELNTVTAAVLTVGYSSGGAITLSNAITIAASDALHLMTAGNVTQGAGDTLSVDNLAITAGGDVTLTQANDVATLAMNVGGDASFIAADALTIASVDSIDGITLTDAGSELAVTVGPGALLTNSDAIATNDGDVTLIADRMVLAAGSINSGAGRTALGTVAAGRAIDLGSATDAAAALELSDAELDTITAAALAIGDATAGAITLSADVDFDPARVDTLHLSSGGTITSAAEMSIESLALSAGGAVSLTGTQDVRHLAADVTGDFTFLNRDDLTITSIDGVDGLAATGDIAVTTSGLLTNAQAIDADAVTLIADRMALAGGTVDPTGEVALGSATAGRAIDLGSATDAAAALELSDAELDTIAAASLAIGDVAAGDIAVTAAVTYAGPLQLTTDGSVTQSASLGATDLGVTATGDIALTNAANDVDTLVATTDGALAFTDADGVTLDGITAADDITITAGTITNGGAVASTTGDIALAADRMALAGGTVNSPGEVTLHATTAGRAIDLGSATDAAAALELSDAELDTVTAATLVVGDAAAGSIAVTAAISRAGALQLTTDGSVTQSASLTATDLGVTATGDITLTHAANDVDTLAATTDGALAFTDSDGVTLDGITAADDIAITAAAITNSGAAASTAGDVALAADRMTLAGGTITTLGDATLRSVTAGRAIDLGSATDAAAGLELSDAELDTIAAGRIVVGDAGAGAIAITAAISHAGPLQLTTGGAVTQSAAIAIDDLSVTSAGAVTLNHAANAVGAFAASVSGAGNALTLRNSTDLSLGGVTTNDGDVTFTVTGELTTTQAVAAGAGDITITADDVALGAGLTATGTLTLQPRLVATSIGVANGAGGFSLDAAEIAQLSDGFGAIHIGRADGEHAITVGSAGATFTDPLTLHAPAGAGTITIDGTLANAGANDAITIDGPGATTYLNADITTAGGDILISDSVVVGDGLSVALDSGGGDIRITGTVSSAAAATLVFDAAPGSGDVTLDDTVSGALSVTLADVADVTVVAFNTTGSLTSGNAMTGGFTATGRLTVGLLDLAGTSFDVQQGFASAGTTTFDNSGVLTIAGQNSTSAGAFTATGDADLAVNITTSNADLSLGGSVTLSDDVTLSTGAGAGDLTVGGDIDGAHALTLAAGTGTIDLQSNVGDATAPTSLTASAAAIGVHNVQTTGAQSYTAATTTLGNLTTTNSAITITGDAALRGDTTIATGPGGGAITITGDLDGSAPGSDSLLLTAGTGAITLGGSTGGATALADLTATGATVSVANVTTTGDQAYTGTTTLQGDLTTAGGDVDLNSATHLGDDVTLTTLGGDVTFAAAVNATVAGQQQLGVDAGVGSVTFAAGVGTGTALEAIDVTGGAISLRTVTTTGDQAYTGPAILAGNLNATGGDVRLNDIATLDADITVSARDVTFAAAVNGDVAGTRDLTIAATRDAAFDAAPGSVGGGTALRTITVTADTLALGDVTTTGSQSYTAATTLAGTYATSGGNITLSGDTTLAAATVMTTAGGDLTFDGDLDGPHGLTINLSTGDLTATGRIGQLQRLGALAVAQARDIDLQRNVHVASLTVGDARDVRLQGVTTTDGGDVTVVARRNVTAAGTIDTRSSVAGGAGGDVDLRTSGSGGEGDITVAAIRTDGADAAVNGQAGGNAGYILLQPDAGLSNGGTLPDGRLIILGSLSAVAGQGNNAANGGGGQVFLAPLGRATVPAVATIHSHPTFGGLSIIATGNIAMGQNEKLVVPGSGSSGQNGVLSLRSLGGSIHVGDLGARRSISVVADTGNIVMLTRPRGGVLLANGTTVTDSGLDVYAGGAITFSGPIALGGLGGPKPVFVSKTPEAISGPVGDSRFLIRRFSDTAVFVDGGGTMLDIAGAGGTFVVPPPVVDDLSGATAAIAGASRTSAGEAIDDASPQATALLRKLDTFVVTRLSGFEAAMKELIARDGVGAFVAGNITDEGLARDLTLLAAMMDEAQRLPLPPARIEAVQQMILHVAAPSTATPHVDRLVNAWRGQGGSAEEVEIATVPVR